MACLALSLQPLNGPDVLLQTREWFPPARAALASQSFRTTRVNDKGKSPLTDQQPLGLGNDPVSAASGQVVVGKESKYRVVYRLVNSVYVLGITTADQDVDGSVFECASTVNQAVSVLVAACKGIDVTSDKVLRKYTEVYMALDVVLRGVSAARLATILASFHGEGITQIVVQATDTENRARGADSWNLVQGQSMETANQIQILSEATFEMPEETLAAGDAEIAALSAPRTDAPFGASIPPEKTEEKPPENEDPFAASERINKPEELLTGSGFKKDKDVSKDVIAGLNELTVVPVSNTGGEKLESVEGFEGNYGDLDYDPADGGFGDAFEGLTDAFGGGLDPAEFGATTEKQKKLELGLGGLEELEGGGGKKADAETAGKDENAADGVKSDDKMDKIDGPVVWLAEEVYAEFKGSALVRVGLQGALLLKTKPPTPPALKQDETQIIKDETEFSFSLDGADVIKRVVVKKNVVGDLGDGVYYVRAPRSESVVPILQYRLLPQFTPIPLRLCLVSKQNPLTVSFMIMYAPNPFLRGILEDVVFIVSLPFAPSAVKMEPRGIFDKEAKQVRWIVPALMPQAIPQRLRAQLPLSSDYVPSLPNPSQENGDHEKPKEFPLQVRVAFSGAGQSLSGISVSQVPKDSPPVFAVGEHVFRAGKFQCS